MICRSELPTEAQEQEALFAWAEWQLGKHPELALLHHIPNGGSRRPAEARRLKAQGVKPGVPDLCLPVARGGYHGLYIELKRSRGGRLGESQRKWLASLAEAGYLAVVARGHEEAERVLTWYLEGKWEKQCGGRTNR